MNGVVKSKGFTLIELVVVIVILGILSVTAAPRFLNIQSDAKTATLNGMKGAMEAAMALSYGKLAINGLENGIYTATTTPELTDIFPECTGSCGFRFGYPDPNQSTWPMLVNGLSAQVGEADFFIINDAVVDDEGEHLAIKATIAPSHNITGSGNVGTLKQDNCYLTYAIFLTTPQEPSIKPEIEVVDCE